MATVQYLREPPPKRDWKALAMKLPTEAWGMCRYAVTRSGPTLFMVSGVVLAYAIGAAGGSSWWTLVSCVLGGFAIAAAEDRAEARAAKDWAAKFWAMLETDHVLEVSVTHHNAKPEQ